MQNKNSCSPAHPQVQRQAVMAVTDENKTMTLKTLVHLKHIFVDVPRINNVFNYPLENIWLLFYSGPNVLRGVGAHSVL